MEGNIVNENLETNVSLENANENIEETTQENADALANDSIALAYDYYDHYYEDVTKSLSRIESTTSVMMDNQNELIDKLHAINTTCSTFTFIVTLIFVYILIRNMIIIK